MSRRANLLHDALDTWAPGWPRRVTRNQYWSHNQSDAVSDLLDAEGDGGNEPFISTYSFPRGHTRDGSLPCINTLFFDFDIDDGDYVRGSGDREAWKRDLSRLLVRVRRVAGVLRNGDRAESWRASLSGHKGIHLYLDFPALPTSLGKNSQYTTGLNDYATDLINHLETETGISNIAQYVDVTSSDLGRLCRVPNTRHTGATESFGEDRYCVPVTLAELTEITPEKYEEYTQAPRDLPWSERHPSQEAHERLIQYINLAEPSKSTTRPTSEGSTTIDWSRVDQYEQESNDNLTLNDVELLTSDMPCVWKFHEREDKFQHGYQSHVMENHCIAKLTEENFPISVIKEFLSNAPEYNEHYTEERIRELIARDFNPYRTEKLLERAPEFCGYDFCARCQSVLADQATNTT